MTFNSAKNISLGVVAPLVSFIAALAILHGGRTSTLLQGSVERHSELHDRLMKFNGLSSPDRVPSRSTSAVTKP